MVQVAQAVHLGLEVPVALTDLVDQMAPAVRVAPVDLTDLVDLTDPVDRMDLVVQVNMKYYCYF